MSWIETKFHVRVVVLKLLFKWPFCMACLIISVNSAAWKKNGLDDFGNVTCAFYKLEGTEIF